MSRRVGIHAVVLTAIVTCFGGQRGARAQTDAVDAVRKVMKDGDEALQNCLPTRTRAALAKGQTAFAALGEFEKEKVESDFKNWSDRVTQQLAGRTTDSVFGFVNGRLSQAESQLDGCRNYPD